MTPFLNIDAVLLYTNSPLRRLPIPYMGVQTSPVSVCTLQGVKICNKEKSRAYERQKAEKRRLFAHSRLLDPPPQEELEVGQLH